MKFTPTVDSEDLLADQHEDGEVSEPSVEGINPEASSLAENCPQDHHHPTDGGQVVLCDDAPPAVVPGDNSPDPTSALDENAGCPPVVPDNDEAPPLVPGDAEAPQAVPSHDTEENHCQSGGSPGRGTQPPPETLTTEMRQWLSDNWETYEFYLLHALLHDPLWRTKMISTPVIADDFWRMEYALVMGGVIGAVKVLGVMNHSLPCPPSREFLQTYIEVAARQEGAEDEEVAGALKLVSELQDPKFKEMHYTIAPYFVAWYVSRRAKWAARELNKYKVPDVHGQLAAMQQALDAASYAVRADEDDPYFQFVNSTTNERQPRSSTGIEGLDECLNGGWGKGECYLVFGGTNCGKSIIAGQCAWHEAKQNDGYSLIVSTELWPREYGARIISCGCTFPINLLHDCETFDQIRQAAASDPSLPSKLQEVDEALQLFKERVFISKVSADDGMDARALLEREVRHYEKHFGRKPTWVCLDWLGSVVDQNSKGRRGGAAERATEWEYAATGCVKFAEATGIPTMVLAQAVNDTQKKTFLTIGDIGISKGIGKNMTAVIGLTNSINTAAATRAASPPMFKPLQKLCVCKSRKGEGRNIPIQRDFIHQRFVAPSEEAKRSADDEAAGNTKHDKRSKYLNEVSKVFNESEILSPGDLKRRIMDVLEFAESTAKERMREYRKNDLIKKVDGQYQIARPQPKA